MKISILSNIALPGLGQEDSLEIDRPGITLREFLEELSKMSGRRNVTYVESGAQAASDGWEVLINGRDVQESGGMDMELDKGNVVTVNMQVIGGG